MMKMKIFKGIRRMCRVLVEKSILVIMKLVSLVGEEYAEVALRIMCREYEKHNGNFIQYRLYPKTAKHAYAIDLMDETPKMAIVIQGPLDRDDNFTLETVRLYKIYYPDAYIIVSTWEDEEQKYLEEIKKAGAIVVTSSYPDKRGRGNVNYQDVSTLRGLEKAKELGVEYVMKNRSDMRMYRRYALQYMYNLCKEYSLPSVSKGEKYHPHHRIITEGIMFDSDWIQDFFYFGYIDDLLAFFKIPLDESTEYKRYENDEMLRARETRKDFLDICGAPQYLVRCYLDKIGACRGGIREYWDIVKNYFLCIGWEELEFYWHKYDVRYSMNLRQSFDIQGDVPSYPLTYKWRFSNWFCLYREQIKYDEDFEKYEQNMWMCGK